MIISASYRTDIPTFYGEWFVKRLRAGYCKAVNPYSRKVYAIDLRPAAVDGIVFWSKNASPFLRRLPEIADRGFRFIVQHTINGYPRALETSVVEPKLAVETGWKIRDLFGPDALVWRYDTIVFSDLTPGSFHEDNFARLAGQLRGATNEVVISFAQLYEKTLRNMNVAAGDLGFEWWDPPPEEKRALVAQLADVAAANGMTLTVCSQPALLSARGKEARCIDAQRLARVLGREVAAKLKGNRAECGCFESRDVGEYDTCPHGCVYCYAVQSREVAVRRFKMHDPDSDFLFPPPPNTKAEEDPQLPLLGR